VNSTYCSGEADASPEILLERREGVGIITLNRPAERNPISITFTDAMLRILDEVDQDQGLHAVILTGAGRVFCAGAELGKVVHPDGVDTEKQFGYVRGYGRVIQRLRELDLPVIAAVNGAAVGGGASLAMACDIALAAEDACYYFAFGRVGAAGCDMGCSYFLPKLVGTQRANQWLFTGATVNAVEGKAAGLFAGIAPRETLLAQALEVAAQIKVATPRRAAAATKMAVLRGQDSDLQTCLSYETYIQTYLFTTDEHKSRLRTLMDRTKPRRT
jgi:enoyl-CoA hydratase/carnithine racemase